MAHLPSRKAREDFSDTINRVAFGNERVVLRRRGKEVAAVVPIADLRLLEELEDRMISSMPEPLWLKQRKKAQSPLM